MERAVATTASFLSSAEFTGGAGNWKKQHSLPKSVFSNQHGALSQQEPPTDSKADGNSAESVLCGLIFGSIRRICPRGILSLQCFNQDREQKAALRLLLHASQTQKTSCWTDSSLHTETLGCPLILTLLCFLKGKNTKRSAFTATTAINQLQFKLQTCDAPSRGQRWQFAWSLRQQNQNWSSGKKIKLELVSVLYRCGGDTMHLQRTV